MPKNKNKLVKIKMQISFIVRIIIVIAVLGMLAYITYQASKLSDMANACKVQSIHQIGQTIAIGTIVEKMGYSAEVAERLSMISSPPPPPENN